MLFNSLPFLVFLPLVFCLYWLLNRGVHLRWQNLLLLVASYVFYGWWDVRFLSLIAFSTLIDFAIGRQIASNCKDHRRARWWLLLSLLTNLSLLGYFKYANFFIESWVNVWAKLGVDMDISTMNIILPVGISFYTFQTLSYTIDIYRGKLKPTNDLIAFATFVAFFPQLVAGPIERARDLLPQITRRRRFDADFAASGLRLMLWGLIKKVVIADTAGRYVNAAYSLDDLTPVAVCCTAALFAIQIYGDFSGYSDVAIGTARLFGVRLSTNFRLPFFSRDMREFWQRWHISLTSWFMEYVYIPLGGSRKGKWRSQINVMIVFLVSGLWHGASWNFILWGLMHGLLLVSINLIKGKAKHRRDVAENRWWPTAKEALQIMRTFGLFALSMIFFRLRNLDKIQSVFAQLLGLQPGHESAYRVLEHSDLEKFETWLFVWALSAVILIEWSSRLPQIHQTFHRLPWLRHLSYIIGCCAVLLMTRPNARHVFIYFQF